MLHKLKACKKKIVKFLNKSLGLGGDGFVSGILEASGRISYVETMCNRADSLHWRINRCYERDLQACFLDVVKCCFPKLKSLVLSIDITDEPFYSKFSSLHIHGWTGERGIQGKFQYIVVSAVQKEKIPIMALPFPVFAEKAECIEQLINAARKVCKKIDLVMLDRGFYSGAVIQKFQELKLNYLIFVPKNQAIKKYIEQKVDTVEHTIKWNANRTFEKVTTPLVLVEYDNKPWCFATNIKLEKAIHYIFQYKKRWQIETDFRIQDEARIKSKSRNHLIRYFYFLTSLLLQLIWRTTQKITFKRFVMELERINFFETIGIDYIQTS